MTAAVLVAAGGFFGAAARYAVSVFFSARSQSRVPYGTLMVNLSGSFLLGIIISIDNQTLSLLFGTGFLGAFTTFSTFKVEGVQLWQSSKYKVLMLYYALSYSAGILFAFMGYGLGRMLG